MVDPSIISSSISWFPGEILSPNCLKLIVPKQLVPLLEYNTFCRLIENPSEHTSFFLTRTTTDPSFKESFSV